MHAYTISIAPARFEFLEIYTLRCLRSPRSSQPQPWTDLSNFQKENSTRCSGRALFIIPGPIINSFLNCVCKQGFYKRVFKHPPKHARNQVSGTFSAIFAQISCCGMSQAKASSTPESHVFRPGDKYEASCGPGPTRARDIVNFHRISDTSSQVLSQN
jgi:hypothetical protein